MALIQKRMLIRGVDIALRPLDDKPHNESENIELWVENRFEGVFSSSDAAIAYVKEEIAEPQGALVGGVARPRRSKSDR